MNKLHILFLFFTICNLALGQSLSDDYDSFRKSAEQAYKDFKNTANDEYAEFVKKAWRWYNTQPAITRPKERIVPPVVIGDDKIIDIKSNPIIIEEQKVEEPEPQPTPIYPIRHYQIPNEKSMRVMLYGTNFTVRVSEDLIFQLRGVEPQDISNAWKQLSSGEYNNLVRDCLEMRIINHLSDWAYLRLIDAVCAKWLGVGSNEAELLKAYIYTQSGYKMRLAVSEGNLRMLFGSKHQIYELPYIDIDGVYYYPSTKMPNAFQISQAEFPGERPMSLYITQQPTLSPNLSNVIQIKSNNVEWMTAEIKENINLIAYFNDYPASQIDGNPLTRWAMYAQTPLSDSAKSTLYPVLRKWIEDLSVHDAVDCLCHWIQTGFEYEYDDKLWGHDRAFFADETLYYPYCDCEDRSILLTRIVRDLLGLDCALVYYPGHLATAIAMGEDIKGDFIRLNGKKFIICDPTYINAPIGLTMPGMDNSVAKAILLK